MARDYTATTTAGVVSTAGDATLSIGDPSVAARGRVVNGAFMLGDPLQAMASSTGGGSGSGAFAPLGDGLALLTYSGPVSNDAVSIAFRQRLGAAEPLRTGTYSKTLTSPCPPPRLDPPGGARPAPRPSRGLPRA